MLTRKTAPEEFNGFLAAGTSFEGDLHFSGTLHLNGNVRGSITTTDVLIIGEHASVEADIKAGELQIYGTVIGDIDCSRRVEICETGRLQGAVRAPSLVIKEGGIFEGTSRTSSLPEAHENEWESGDKTPELQQLTS